MKPKSEAALRRTKTPRPRSIKQLTKVIDSLVNRPHDYGTCVYAMSIAAAATFEYVACQLGVSGFQASVADLDFMRRIRHIDGPFMLVTGDRMLYPQYDLHKDLDEVMEKWLPWAAEKAAKLLKEGHPAHPDVIDRWQNLVYAAEACSPDKD